MAITLNIGMDNIPGHLSRKRAQMIAFHMIGGSNIREHKMLEMLVDEPTYVVELFVDIEPSKVYRLALALGQQAVAYYNDDTDEPFGLLIGPEADQWDGGQFNASKFLLIDGTFAA